MDRIKSAYEMALERFQQRKEVPQSEIERMEYIPAGKTLAANFLRESGYDILAETGKYPENVREYIIEGVQETFLSNLSLPVDQSAQETNKRVMEGLFLIKKEKESVGGVFSQLEYLFRYYEQSLSQIYGQFKESFSAKMSAKMKSLEKRVGAGVKIDPEKQPGFREEWLKVIGRLNDQYGAALNEQKDKLRNIK